jgi:hypothetical protein
LVERAIADLKARLGVTDQDIAVQAVAETEFPDASLDVPEPGTAYAPATTPGYIVRLVVDGRVYQYHCSSERVVLSEPDTVLMIRSVQVDAGQISVSGWNRLPDGTCILTELYANGQRQDWWPMDTCATVHRGEWQISARLGRGDAPVQLEKTPWYEVRAWQRGHTSTSVVFPFDLEGPPTPAPQQARVTVEVPSRWRRLLPEITYQPVIISDVGLMAEIPSGWRRIVPEWSWTPEESGRVRICVDWLDIEPPTIPEAALLPKHAQILDSKEVTLSWGSGRSFLLEVYEEAVQGADQKAPVQAIELHTLVFADRADVDRGDARRAFDLYATAPTSDDLDALRPVLQHMLDTSVLEASQAPTSLVLASQENWPVFRDDRYGFAFSHPANWTVRELQTEGLGMPDDWPVAETMQILPSEWAEELDRRGPPDPSRPSVAAPLNLEVCIGPLAQYHRAYPEPAQSETITVNGIAVSVERNVLSDRITQIRYVFPSPRDGELRIVLNDMLTGFADRVAENEAVVQAIPLIVATFEFTE